MNMVVKGLLVAGMTSLGLLAGLGAVKMQSAGNQPTNEIGNSATNAEPEASDVEWVEVDDFENEAELPHRPGNIGVLAAVVDFVEGQRAIRPVLRSSAFPVLFDGKLVESADAYEDRLRALEVRYAKRGKKPSNKIRGYNVYYKQLVIEEYVDGKLAGNAGMELKERELERVALAKKHHPERMFVVKTTLDVASLQSVRTDKDLRDVFAVSKKADGWKVVYYDK